MSSSLNKAQKATVASFCSIVSGASEKQAVSLLKTASWSLQGAIDQYYESGLIGEGTSGSSAAASATLARGSSAAAASVKSPSPAKAPKGTPASRIEEAFAKFQDPDVPGRITAEGIERLCGELGVDMYSDIVVLILSYHMGAKTMGEFTEAEWRTGMSAMGVDTIAGLKAKLPALRAELKSPAMFSAFYAWAYDFNCDEGQKSLSLETAIALFPMLVTKERWPLVDVFVEFLNRPGTKSVSKDTWVQLGQFMRDVDPKLTNFDEAAAWPVQVDDFVEFCRKNKRV